MYHGDIRLGDTIDVKFTTRQISGAPSTLSGSPVISAYPGNSTTELTAGITLSVDFDSRTGLNNVRVVASSGNGYATATNYTLVITTGTVNSVSVVGECIGSFSIEARSALMPTTAARTLVVDANGLADANAVKLGPTGAGTAQTARDIGASVLLSAGSGTGQLDFTSGVVKANLAQILATALTETAGQLAGGFKKFFNIATPASTMDALTLVATATNLTNAPTNGDFTAAMKISLNAATPASVTGAVGSVTGAVGSVTGNVGGNVVGSVASVTAGVTVTTNNDKTGYALTAGERNSVADALLDRDMSTGTDSGSPTVRTPRQAMRFMRNKWSISAGTLTVTKEDDSTASWTAAITTNGTTPVDSVDPA